MRRPCNVPGCRRLTVDGRCSKHRAARVSPSRRGYGRRWQRQRALELQREPFCVDCGADAVHRDHIVPRRLWEDAAQAEYLRSIGAPADPDDARNVVSRCHGCHSRKTVEQDGGLGRAVRLAERVAWNVGQHAVVVEGEE